MNIASLCRRAPMTVATAALALVCACSRSYGPVMSQTITVTVR